MKMEAWEEALDVDESDFPSILRPCNRPLSVPDCDYTLSQLHSDSSTTLEIEILNNPLNFGHLQDNAETLVASQPSLSQSCAKRRRQLIVSESHAETLADSQRSPPPVCSDAVRPRSIPGPAGAVLAAFRRRRSEIREAESEENMPALSTQEYLRKAVNGNGANSEFDDDFKKPSWFAALEFSERENAELTSSASATVPLGSIRNCGTQKLSKVVAMIKSCTPNGFGDFLVTLKDPSGTISASIHRSVVIEGNYGCYLSVGAVLVLQKVSIFVPRADFYLNITHKNIVKIFPKDFESLSNTVSGISAVPDCSGSVLKSPMVQNHNSSYAGVRLTSRSTANEVVGTVCNFGGQSMNEQLEGNNSTKDAASKSLQNIEKRNEPTGETTVLNSSTDINNKEQAAFMGGNYPSALRGELPGEANEMIHKTSAVESNGANKQMQSLTSLSSLPQWTDEQLEELLVED